MSEDKEANIKATAVAVTPMIPQGPQGSERPTSRGNRPDRSFRPGGRRRDFREQDDKNDSLVEKTVFINRSSKVVKGGRRFSFSALIVVGDKGGRVGLGLGKGHEVSDAIRKGGDNARSKMSKVPISKNTIPHQVTSEFDGACILLKPASPGTGLICGKTVRAVVESAGVKDILSKSLGSKNPANVAKATLKALLSLRSRERIFEVRGLQITAR